jgi:hypothetical protein
LAHNYGVAKPATTRPGGAETICNTTRAAEDNVAEAPRHLSSTRVAGKMDELPVRGRGHYEVHSTLLDLTEPLIEEEI